MVATIVTDAGKGNAEGLLWYSFVQAAVYNAVVGITHHYELYEWNVRGPRAASPEAAAAAAAHAVLLYYFPASSTRLDNAYDASLAKIPDGTAKAKASAMATGGAHHRAAHGRRPQQSRCLLQPPVAVGGWRVAPDPPRQRVLL
jgi:hypothetical protein